ncbi:MULTISPECIES: HTH-type transcriptional activator IlvY [unclassified Avibacterium]|uniref:HTH-type transcriptional activator IlvY n=1 Tax=unclassified Avibacterium TaxID=2685287 RepID=UPI002025D336|nr:MULTISPECIES: HTH-type transcriptional activator IlvY [unclassified Avibacterium]URL02058.1 HTH-type transcriptional activator IlvY [Avibacterium sp. 20-126]MCW9699228.1 HTH-type transcriptional activator IlvY [Avibacterium sp. 20-129]MCW9718826.1 HTH-type transcriptional activator IlvY [Avibacterium sp. 21-599]MCW9732893.1 HTH-type transcriptional activator IlvY [Avibacterium sp. 20-15]URL05028.1 HTH-type transcriptional activator IlvY [Avibacterium sp. 20-132]
MEFQDLKLFIDLAENKHFAKTAEQHYMSPSTLSRQIKRIEEALGETLLLRDNRKVSLTPAGELFLQFAYQQWQQWLSLKQQFHTNQQELQGELRLFCSVTAAYSHLPQMLEKFRLRYPKVEIQLTTGDPAQALEMIQRQQVDLALAGRPAHLPQNVMFHYIDAITLSLIAPRVACATTQLLQQMPIDWQKVPFILPVEGPARQRIDQWFQQKKIKHPTIYATVSGHEGIVSMVALGCGVALLPDVVIENSPLNSQVSTLTIDTPVQPFDLGLCMQKNRLNLPLVRAFWQMLE